MGIFSKNCLGIDIGASSIKIVEVSGFGKRKKLENYVEFQLPPTTSSIKTFYGESLLLVSDEVSEILQAIFKKAKIKQKKAIISIPDFSTFFTTFTLPPMTEAEIPQAVEFEARHHIPLPLSEVNFDWQIIEKEEVLPGVKLKILLVAVPNKVLQNYQRMATLAQLEVVGMEAEVFGLIRSSIPKEKSQHPVCAVDIGWQSTTISIVEKGSLQISHSFDISGTGLTKALSEKLKIDFKEAEKLKKEYGLDPHREDVSKILCSEVNSLALEIEKVCQDFYHAEGKKVENLIIAGGTASLFGLKEYLEERVKKKVEIADSFSSLSYPSILRPRLQELGPSFAVAVGVGLGGIEI
jgi:type IV pilus assembly protein PilM